MTAVNALSCCLFPWHDNMPRERFSDLFLQILLAVDDVDAGGELAYTLGIGILDEQTTLQVVDVNVVAQFGYNRCYA